jgi:hypothetical protein
MAAATAAIATADPVISLRRMSTPPLSSQV